MTFMKKSVIFAVVLASLTVINQRSAEAKPLDNDNPSLFKELTPTFPITNPVKSKPIKALSESDIRCLEAVVYNETRGNKAQGAILVGATVFNRANSKYYPNTICGVAYQKAQFTNIRKVQPHHINKQTRDVVQEIIERYYNGTLNKAVMYFHNTTVVPKWSHKKKRVAKVGAHIFYAR
jgi:spore germination cell wall hydrolase CwlJ-like protein